MVHRNVEAIVDKEHLFNIEALLHVFDFFNHFFYRPEDSPSALFLMVSIVALSGADVIKAGQLGEHTYAETRLTVFIHL